WGLVHCDARPGGKHPRTNNLEQQHGDAAWTCLAKRRGSLQRLSLLNGRCTKRHIFTGWRRDRLPPCWTLAVFVGTLFVWSRLMEGRDGERESVPARHQCTQTATLLSA